MCPWYRTCALCMTCFVATEILCCGFENQECPYSKNKEPDFPHKEYSHYLPTPTKAVVMASGSSLSDIGQYITDLPDGRRVFSIDPKNVNISGGTIRLVNGEGKETHINF